jgi:hypothetical protein
MTAKKWFIADFQDEPHLSSSFPAQASRAWIPAHAGMTAGRWQRHLAKKMPARSRHFV